MSARSTVAVVLALSVSVAGLALVAPLALADDEEKFEFTINSSWEDAISVPASEGGTIASTEDGICSRDSALHACEGEDGHYAAIRLVPDVTPFHVQAVDYALSNKTYPLSTGTLSCEAHRPHEVFVFKGDDSSLPDADPTELERHSIPAASPSSYNARWVTINLNKTIRLDAGEALYIAVEMPGSVSGCTDSGDALCLYSCVGDGDETFWSFATDPSYSWSSLQDVNVPLDGVGVMHGFSTP